MKIVYKKRITVDDNEYGSPWKFKRGLKKKLARWGTGWDFESIKSIDD
jgi:hypothetical protein